MAKRQALSGGYQIGHLVDQSGGMVGDIVHPTLLQDSEAHFLQNNSLDEKGTVKPGPGRQRRFDTSFDAVNPCNGIYPFYPDTATSKLVFGAGTKLYSDTPHLLTSYDTQAEWDTGTHNLDTATTAGDLEILTPPVAGYSGTPAYDTGKFNQGLIVKETNNLLTANQSDVETDAAGFTASNATITRVTSEYWHGAASLQVITAGVTSIDAVYIPSFAVTASKTYTFSVYVKGSGNLRIQLSERDSSDVEITAYQTFFTATGTWTRYTVTGTFSASGVKARLYIGTNGTQAVTFYVDGLQFEQRAYATPWVLGGTAGSPGTLTIPTAGVFKKSNWAIELYVQPTSDPALYGAAKTLFAISIDANNSYQLGIDATGHLFLTVKSGGTSYTITDPTALSISTWYAVMIAGDGSVIRLCKDGSQIGSDTSCTEPAGTLPANLYIGAWIDDTGIPTSIIDDLRISSRARTLAEHQAYVAGAAAQTWDIDTTYLLLFDNSLDNPVNRSGNWISPVIDCSSATSKSSGKIVLTSTIPGGSSITVESCSAPTSGGTYTAYVAALGDGTLQHTADNYVKVRLSPTKVGTDSASVQKLVISFDGTPTYTQLDTGYTAGNEFYFATLLSTMVVTNRADAPKKWDGTAAIAALGGTPPHGQYVAAHRNYLFMAHTTANPSRLFFSEVLNIESWPALNFIDVSPNDGDWITGLLPYDDYLIVTKQRSVWVLVGAGTSDFAVRRIHDGIGCIAPRSLVRMGETFFFVAQDGGYVSDLSSPLLITERLKEEWKALNLRRLNQIAAEYYDHKLRIDAPNGASIVNDIRIVYDGIRKCLYLEKFAKHASCWCKYIESGQEILLYGHSSEGQASRADYGTTDDGAAILSEWETKHFNFGSSATVKKGRNMYLVAVPAVSDTTVNVYFIVDGVEIATPLPVTVTGDPDHKIATHKVKPRDAGVSKFRTLGYRITQSTTNGGARIHEILQEYMVKKYRAS